ncbi:MAG: hypothetical protein QM809_14285 [Gordonia sp. (in: high G+C Gram-positive bacteria)]|uniref:type IV toxin-antitoxin system AbiEi family antitoxin domain-containing protein n=1 Tax=Gordonia sp. (in: high G+C Gram-positive bacteria) TaxID=84139 RepID=UPI0039E38083
MEIIADRHGIVRRSAVLRAGYSDAQLAALTASGRLEHLGHGDYIEQTALPPPPQRDDARYRYRCVAFATAGRGEPPVLSHQSVAAVHRLALLKADLGHVHVFSGRRGGGHVRHRRRVHAGVLTAADVVTVDGIRVTSLARTAIDLACAGTFAQALTALDGALRLGATPEALRTELHARRRVGSAMAARALEFADGRSESVGESWSRAQLILAGLPVPDLQVRHRGRCEDYRVDFEWGGRLVGEFDGIKKYRRDLRRKGESVEDAVLREKSREDELRGMGLMVIRWVWADLENGRVAAHVSRWLTHLGLA